MRTTCEQCHQIGYLQTIGNYHRVRHYDGVKPDTGKSNFHYHQQSRDWVQKQLAIKDSGCLI